MERQSIYCGNERFNRIWLLVSIAVLLGNLLRKEKASRSKRVCKTSVVVEIKCITSVLFTLPFITPSIESAALP